MRTMSKVIKNGTVVTADRTWKADVLIDGGKIVQIGANLSGNKPLDTTGCYVMPGRHRPAHPSRNAVHGHLFHQ